MTSDGDVGYLRGVVEGFEDDISDLRERVRALERDRGISTTLDAPKPSTGLLRALLDWRIIMTIIVAGGVAGGIWTWEDVLGPLVTTFFPGN